MSPAGRRTYRRAGVDRAAADRLVGSYARLAKSARTPLVLADVGGFAGRLLVPPSVPDPVVVVSTDGLGSKTHLAARLGRYDGLGADLVAANVHDVLCGMAQPLGLVDYLGVGRLRPKVAEAVVASVARACRESGVALLGGETAEIPAVYGASPLGDLVGTAFGVASRGALSALAAPAPGDALVALPSSGLHANGLTLARALLEDAGVGLGRRGPRGGTWGEELLTPSRLLAPAVAALQRAVPVKALCHVTGGGLPGNLVRILPCGVEARLERRRLPEATAPLWRALSALGPVRPAEMARTFNLGVAMVAVLAPEWAEAALAALDAAGVGDARVLGRLRKTTLAGPPRVRWAA